MLSANGRVKPDWVIVADKENDRVVRREERHTEGSDYIEWHEGSKRVRVSEAVFSPSIGP